MSDVEQDVVESAEPTPTVEDKKGGEIKFSQVQQDKIQRLINEKFKEAYTKADAKYKSEVESLKKEIESLKSSPDKKEAKPQDNDEVQQLRDKVAESERLLELNRMNFEMLTEKQKAAMAELESERTARLEERKVNTLMASAQKQKFIDPSLVVKLVGDLVKYNTETNGFRVYNEEGQERWNEFMKPMSLDEFMAEYAANHKFLVQGSNTSGTGATEASNTSGRKWTRSEINAMDNATYDKYRNDIFKAMKENRIIDS